jgi:hypothetical protein
MWPFVFSFGFWLLCLCLFLSFVESNIDPYCLLDNYMSYLIEQRIKEVYTWRVIKNTWVATKSFPVALVL